MNDTEPRIPAKTATALVRSLMQDGRIRTRTDVSLAIPEIDIASICKILHNLAVKDEIHHVGLNTLGLRQYQLAKRAAASHTPAPVAQHTGKAQNPPRTNGDPIPTAPAPPIPLAPVPPRIRIPAGSQQDPRCTSQTNTSHGPRKHRPRPPPHWSAP